MKRHRKRSPNPFAVGFFIVGLVAAIFALPLLIWAFSAWITWLGIQ